ncbi:MAG: hypothetical protein HY400_03515 [Elusimicrobia bacterium]|nr:hypothetical protein [Elusimicrobiota bacterium]
MRREHLLPILVISFSWLSSGCTASLKQQIQSQAQRIQALEAQNNEVSEELTREREKAAALDAQLEILDPTPKGEVVPFSDWSASQGRYAGKSILTEARLLNEVNFQSSRPYLMLQSVDGAENIKCFVTARKLDPNSRQLLIHSKFRGNMKLKVRWIKKSKKARKYECVLAKVFHQKPEAGDLDSSPEAEILEPE